MRWVRHAIAVWQIAAIRCGVTLANGVTLTGPAPISGSPTLANFIAAAKKPAHSSTGKIRSSLNNDRF
jgi:hypothetical protein